MAALLGWVVRRRCKTRAVLRRNRRVAMRDAAALRRTAPRDGGKLRNI
jgi:hypothetical protein